MRYVDAEGVHDAVVWIGEVPLRCDRCGELVPACWVVCKTCCGWWGIFCVPCAGEVAVSGEPPLCRVFQRYRQSWVSFF
jgi:hypothetical protein